VLRNLAKTSTPVVEITKDGDVFTLKTLTAIKNSEIKFELGKEFNEIRQDGKTVQVYMSRLIKHPITQVDSNNQFVDHCSRKLK